MKYFSGTLSRDGQPMGDVLGEIRLEQTYLDTGLKEEAIRWAQKGGPSISKYVGSMESAGWKPTTEILGTTARLDADEGFAMNIMITYIIVRGNVGERTQLDFQSVGVPLVMPAAVSLAAEGTGAYPHC